MKQKKNENENIWTRHQHQRYEIKRNSNNTSIQVKMKRHTAFRESKEKAKKKKTKNPKETVKILKRDSNNSHWQQLFAWFYKALETTTITTTYAIRSIKSHNKILKTIWKYNNNSNDFIFVKHSNIDPPYFPFVLRGLFI